MKNKDPHKKEPFSTPEGYFEGFSKSLDFRLKAEENEVSDPTLSGIPKQESFEAPAGYFESFSTRLSTQLHTNNLDSPSRIISFRDRILTPKYMLSAAAAILLLVTGLWIFPSQNNEIQLSESELMEAIEAENVSVYELAEALDDETLAAAFGTTYPEETLDELLDEIDISDLEAEILEEI